MAIPEGARGQCEKGMCGHKAAIEVTVTTPGRANLVFRVCAHHGDEYAELEHERRRGALCRQSYKLVGIGSRTC